MFRWFRERLSRRDAGFTLIELVVVLAIIGILIAAAVPLYLGARKKAYKAEADNTLQEMKTMEWAYYQQNNLFGGTTDIGFTAPSSGFWSWTVTGSDANSAVLQASGTNSPVTGDTITLTIFGSDGHTVESATF
jgi:prepilin-type N-terminal cleavage/methylation domain-containing protein